MAGFDESKKPILVHDNAIPYVAIQTVEKLNTLKIETLPYPPYSPNISPTDYHLFLAINHYLQNKIFKNQQKVECAVANFFATKNCDFLNQA